MRIKLATAARYNSLAIALHWLCAFLILVAFALGLYMVDLGVSPFKVKCFNWHKWLGVTILSAATLRALWRLSCLAPDPVPSLPRWQLQTANLMFFSLYFLLIAIPLTGWVYSSAAGYPVVYLGIKALRLPDLVGRSPELAMLLKRTHKIANWILLGLVSIHVAAALKHHYWDRDTVLARMLPTLSMRAVRRNRD